MSADGDRGAGQAAEPAGERRVLEVCLGRSLVTEVMQLANIEVEARSEAEARRIARGLIAQGKEFDWWNLEDPQEDPGAVTIHGVVGPGDRGDEGGGRLGGMNNDSPQPTDDWEELRRQAEDRYKREDAVRWGIFEGEEPTTRAFVVPPRRPRCRELARFAAPEIDAAPGSGARAAAEGKNAREAGASVRQDLGDDAGDASTGDGGAEEEL